MMENGIIVGCDVNQEWLLPWWWHHYSLNNSYPVAFFDFGMSKKAVEWCKKRGVYMPLNNSITIKKNIPINRKQSWQRLYGDVIWLSREAWLKKPFAMMNSPFSIGIWIDLDCKVMKSIDSIFNCINFNIELAISRNGNDLGEFLYPTELSYNSGVIAFKKNITILKHWVDMITKASNSLPGDQDFLSRAIFVHKPNFLELPSIYNWYRVWGENQEAVIYHYSGGHGKIAILNEIKKNKKLAFFINSK